MIGDEEGTTMPKIAKLTLLAASITAITSNAFSLQINDTEHKLNTSSYNSTTDRIIVKYKAGYRTGLAKMLNLPGQGKLTRNQLPASAMNPSWQITHSIHSAQRMTSAGAIVFELTSKMDIDQLNTQLDQLNQDPNIEYAEPDLIMHIQKVPNDERYLEQWNYFEAEGGMNLPRAWDMTTGSKEAIVAVIDTGVLPHDDLKANLLGGYDFISDAEQARDQDGRDGDPTDEGDWATAGSCGGGYPKWSQPSSWHGTHVAGTIAAVSNNNRGVSGVAWNSKVLPIRALGHCGGYSSDIIEGIRWAAGYHVAGVPDNPTPAKVINLSLGGYGSCTRGYQEAIDEARQQGVTIVVAAGNDNDYASRYSPANCEGVITVAANNREGGRAYYSNYGRSVDITAPGGETSEVSSSDGILSTLNTGSRSANLGEASYGYYQGTSMAAPHVAGLVSLMYSLDLNLTPDDAENFLKETARAFPDGMPRACTLSSCGAGIVDAEAVLTKVLDQAKPLPEEKPAPEEKPSELEGMAFTSDQWHFIPDNDKDGIRSRIFVNAHGIAKNVTISVNIKHDYIGDLKIHLIGPTGKSVTLLETSDDTADNLKTSWTVNASSVPAFGEWSLEVSDHYRQDTGYLKSWGIQFE
jgi:serine protease